MHCNAMPNGCTIIHISAFHAIERCSRLTTDGTAALLLIAKCTCSGDSHSQRLLREPLKSIAVEVRNIIQLFIQVHCGESIAQGSPARLAERLHAPRHHLMGIQFVLLFPSPLLVESVYCCRCLLVIWQGAACRPSWPGRLLMSAAHRLCVTERAQQLLPPGSCSICTFAQQ